MASRQPRCSFRNGGRAVIFASALLALSAALGVAQAFPVAFQPQSANTGGDVRHGNGDGSRGRPDADVVSVAGAGVRGAQPANASASFRGVNLGGWLVLESWITPTLFNTYNVPSGWGEWNFTAFVTATYGRNATVSAMMNHWDTWLTQADIQALVRRSLPSGLRHLR